MMNEISTQSAAEVRYVGVSKTYGALQPAIAELDLEIRAGEFLTLLGPSGSGKTTALNLLAGFQSPSSGSILVDGIDVGALPPHKRNIGVVFQHYALFPHMTVRENIAYPLRQRKVPKTEIERLVSEALRMVALESFGGRMPRQLSGGQQQRVAVARAIVFRPRLLLMDEPLGALDRKLRESVQLELKRIHRELGVTVVFVTHDQEEALVMSDRIAIFNAGRIQQIGTASELYDTPSSQFVAEFLGESNCFVGDVAGEGDKVTGQDGVVVGVKSSATPRHGRAAAVVRPERCRIHARGEGPTEGNLVDARVRDVVYLGSLRKVVADLASGSTFSVVCQPDDRIPSQPDITISFPVSVTRIVTATVQ
ncbi:ABC transporter ATP-binding protein [Ensifer adhaerens]|uniref:ABC transporter ATP-binding protein n=1 Tax=Ensifer adhaerens TaxID=106592 RepID=UPI001C4DDB38|nr:ABC transporter ATP-binding protein [Ensifer adhaerens]MBW0370815.1 ABC transporter ATP-binding protein [Ensifer adhaerens]UCM24273.1 ABC transporter ATP-binding protein [Ensifer adhaerens]